ncbi:hypothetical protein BEV13_02905 [Rickettsiella grylli]|uniref:hypothetical protein n=1 Tax=Rickettsiella grylli TaxID=59196 RepID=UPI0008FD818E|nr:hypothetical protein [Rickettsiella grylli]OJA00647.1 hypothetical protein BEV13_02905 [Rickettsiella grylli]
MLRKASNKRSLFSYSGNAAFKKRIAPKIAAHIEKPIDVSLSGEDVSLNKWLMDNLSTILPIHVRLTRNRSSKIAAKCYPKKGE